MPMVSTTSKKHFDRYKNLFEILEIQIAPLLKGKEPEREFIYELHDSNYSTDDGPAMIAIAKIGDLHAMCIPDYLTDEQLVIFEFVLRDADSNDHIVVFSQRDYDAANKYLYGKKVDVKMML